MAITIFNELPAMFLAYNGYSPFTPGANIFAGGYQGPLYPNPMTLILPIAEFNPSLFPNLIPTEYTMKTEGDFYEGIGVGNPGIKYGNPGHILGILDTYLRMSYGLNILNAARTASSSSSIGESLPILMPLLSVGGDAKTLGSSDLYPVFADRPDAYVGASVGAGGLEFDPRTNRLTPFTFGGTKYKPTTALIDFDILFAGVALNSYEVLIPQFRTLFSQLATLANEFATENEETLSIMPFGANVVDTPKAIDLVSGFSNLAGRTVEFSTDQPTHWKHIGTPLSVKNALLALTEESDFHQVNDTTFEYRSLTELNSVVNILPIQTYGMRFAFLTDNPDIPSGAGNQVRYYVNFSITDMVMNILSFNLTKTVNINGFSKVNFDGIKHVPESILFNTPEFNVEIGRQFLLSISNTNSFSWDKAWLGLEPFNSTDDSLTEFRDIGLSTPTTRTFDFDEAIILKPGNNTVRMRLITQTVSLLNAADSNPDDITIQVNIDVPGLGTITHDYEMLGSIV